MTVRSVSVVLRAQIAGYMAAMRTAARATGDLGTQLQAAAENGELEEVAEGAAVAGVALTGLGVAAVKAFADFDAAMSEVSAATHETAANMELLRTAALQAGADTSFSALEAAGAIRELAKAGLATEDIIGGGLQGALDLAAAGGVEVAEAAELAAVAMQQFGLSGKDVPHVADLLAAAAGKAVGEVTDMGQALNQSALVAAQFGLSIEETTGTLAAFASAGLIGSDAGTSLKTMLLRLANPAGEAADLMERLGIAAYDSAGNFVGLQALAGELREGLGGLTQAERDAAMSIIFGSDAIRAANVLYKQGEDGIQGWTRNVDDAGFAAETASTRLDNLNGDFEKLTGSIETNFIKAGSSAGGVLRTLTQVATALVDSIGRMPPVIGQTATILALFVGLGLAASAALGLIIPRIVAFRAALVAIGPAGARANAALGAMGRWGGIVAGLAIGLIAVGTAIHELEGEIKELDASRVREALDDIAKFGDTSIQASISKSAAGLDRWGDAVDELSSPTRSQQLGHFAGELVNVLTLGTSGTGEPLAKAKNQIQAIDQALAEMVRSGNARDAKKVLDEWMRRDPGEARTLLRMLNEYPAALDEAADSAARTSDQQDELADATDGAKEAFLGAKEAALEYVNQIKGLSDPALAAQAAQDGFTRALRDLKDSIAENGKEFKGNSEAALANREALRETITAALGLSGALAELTGSEAQVAERTLQSRDAIVASLVQMGIAKEEAIKLANSLFKIPEKRTTKIVTNAAGVKVEVDKLTGAIAKLPQKTTIDIFVRYHTGGGPPPPGSGGSDPTFGGILERHGGIHHARHGLITQAGIYSSGGPALIKFAEPATGGEGFVPRFGDMSRSRRIIDVEAGWYGGRVNWGGGGGKTVQVNGPLIGEVKSYGERFRTREVLDDVAWSGAV